MARLSYSELIGKSGTVMNFGGGGDTFSPQFVSMTSLEWLVWHREMCSLQATNFCARFPDYEVADLSSVSRYDWLLDPLTKVF